MTFAHPQLLWLLLLIPLLALYELFWGGAAQASLRFSSFQLLGEESPRRPWPWLAWLRLGVLTLLILALARPQKGQRREQVTAPATDIMLCVDTSSSMKALDFDPKNRLEAAKETIQQFIENRPHDRIGLVVFSALAYTQCPLTLDHGALLGFLDRVQIGMIQQDGTAMGSALATAVKRLKNSQAKSKLIVILTDGRNNRGEIDPLTAAKAADAFGIKVYTVGAGVPGGGKMPVDHPLFGTTYVQIGEELDEEILTRIAQETGGQYFRATNFEKLQEIYREIDALEKTDVEVETFTDYQDNYPFFLFWALGLLCLEITLSQTLLRRYP